MRVLVDTSAWADFLNGHPSPAADALADLLRGDDDVCTCGIVVAEVFQGLRRDEGRDGQRPLEGGALATPFPRALTRRPAGVVGRRQARLR